MKTRQHEEEVKKQEELRRLEESRKAEEARINAEKRKAFNAEKARVERLVSQANDFAKAIQIRNLVEAVKRAGTFTNLIHEGGDLADWIVWASLQADRFDPTIANPPSILDEKIPEDEPQRPRYYGQY